jgi:peptidoglycan hydrolase-like protein with peptidoglycan-binding domain
VFRIKQLFIIIGSIIFSNTVSYGYFFDTVSSTFGKQKIEKKKKKKVPHKRKHTYIKSKQPKVITDTMKIQQALKGLEFYNAKINGDLNTSISKEAISKMNKNYKRDKSPYLDKEAKKILIRLAYFFKVNKQLHKLSKYKKTTIKKQQLALKIHGYYKGKIDGSMGKGTRRSIAKYKKNHPLKDNPQKVTWKTKLIKSAITINDKYIQTSISMLKIADIPKQRLYVQKPQKLKVKATEDKSIGTLLLYYPKKIK